MAKKSTSQKNKTSAKKKKSKPKEPDFAMSIEADSIYETVAKIYKNTPEYRSFTSLEFSEDSVYYETEWGHGEISWQSLNDALALIEDAISPEDYFGLELARDDDDE